MRRFTTSTVQKSTAQAITDLGRYPKPGDKLHGFTLLRSKHVPELELTALHLEHDKTGADYLHIARDDSNNVFSIGFKTIPPNDKGVPHILEHTVLCGSNKYPVKDPFFKMLPRTLSNFMNAFTANDHTYYPFATTNSQDFKNLMSVYLDATFQPLLTKDDFLQEAWNIVPQQAGEDSPTAGRIAAALPPNLSQEEKEIVERFAYTGVVYNEMKGQMSDSSYVFYIDFLQKLFPMPGRWNSGGDPQSITSLSLDELKEFHQKLYHPSNAKIFTYGDMPLPDHLQAVDAALAKHSRGSSPNDKIVENLTLFEPGSVIVDGPTDPLVPADRQYKTSLSWVLNDTSDVLETFALGLLSTLLMDGYGSPLYRGLVETGLGSDWSANAGYDSSHNLAVFSIGLTGVKESDIELLKPHVLEILSQVCKSGFESEKIDGVLHQLELGLKHKSATFGLTILNWLTPKWFIGIHPFGPLSFNDTVNGFKAKLAEGRYLESLIEKYLLKNDKILHFTMKPDPNFARRLDSTEMTNLVSHFKSRIPLDGGLEKAASRYREMEAARESKQSASAEQDLSCLPTVYVADIPRTKQTVALTHRLAGAAASAAAASADSTTLPTTTKVQLREAPTNGLSYFRIINPVALPDELRPYVSLFGDAVMRLGTKDRTVEQLEDAIKLKTGGVSVSYHSSPSPTDFESASEGLIFTGMALDRNVPDMLDLIRTLILETDFESPEAASRIRQLLQTSADGLVNEIASSGHNYARAHAESGLTRNAWLNNQVSGLDQVRLIASLANRPQEDPLVDVIDKLKRIQQLALAPAASSGLRASIICSSGQVSDNSAALDKFLSSLPPSLDASFSPDAELSKRLAHRVPLKTFFPLPYQVYYGGIALATVSYTSPDSAPLQLLMSLLTHKYLHHEIREKGGAYGGGAAFSPLNGLATFYSYRDPNPKNTISAVSRSPAWLTDRALSDSDLEQAKISIFQRIDAPRAVNDEGLDHFLHGLTDDMKQTRREQLLDTTKDQLRQVATKYLEAPFSSSLERLTFIGPEWTDTTWHVENLGVKSEPDVEQQ